MRHESTSTFDYAHAHAPSFEDQNPVYLRTQDEPDNIAALPYHDSAKPEKATILENLLEKGHVDVLEKAKKGAYDYCAATFLSTPIFELSRFKYESSRKPRKAWRSSIKLPDLDISVSGEGFDPFQSESEAIQKFEAAIRQFEGDTFLENELGFSGLDLMTAPVCQFSIFLFNFPSGLLRNIYLTSLANHKPLEIRQILCQNS